MPSPIQKKPSGIARIPLLGPMLTGHWALRVAAILILLAILAAITAFALNGYERVQLGDARIDQVDVALKQDAPVGNESRYCRHQFGQNQEYQTCLAQELKGYRAVAEAWPRARNLGAWREQMIACLLTARHEAGISWSIASRCSESDAPGPDERN